MLFDFRHLLLYRCHYKLIKPPPHPVYFLLQKFLLQPEHHCLLFKKRRVFSDEKLDFFGSAAVAIFAVAALVFPAPRFIAKTAALSLG